MLLTFKTPNEISREIVSRGNKTFRGRDSGGALVAMTGGGVLFKCVVDMCLLLQDKSHLEFSTSATLEMTL